MCIMVMLVKSLALEEKPSLSFDKREIVQFPCE